MLISKRRSTLCGVCIQENLFMKLLRALPHQYRNVLFTFKRLIINRAYFWREETE